MPCPFTGPYYFGLVQVFCARPKIYLHIVAVTNILCQTKRWFAFSKIGFCAGTKVFEEALNAVKFLGWLKKFGPAQNILGPVKGHLLGSGKIWILVSDWSRFKSSEHNAGHVTRKIGPLYFKYMWCMATVNPWDWNFQCTVINT